MPKNKINLDKPPLRLKSHIDFEHKRHFLHYVNELVPDLKESIKELIPKCRELFGSFPEFDESALLLPYVEIVKNCLWNPDQIDSFECFYTIKKYSDTYRPIIEKDEEMTGIIMSLVKQLLNEDEMDLREHFSKIYNQPVENINDSQLEFWTYGLVCDRKRKSSESYNQVLKAKFDLNNELKSFQLAFKTLLNKYTLNKRWLACVVFRSIWDGSGKPQILGSFSEVFPEDLLNDIREELEKSAGKDLVKNLKKATGQDWKSEEKQKKRLTRFMHHTFLPRPNAFIYDEHFWLHNPFERYEEKAVEAYRQHLQDYFLLIKKILKKHDYKETQGDRYKYHRIKWLVWWNNKNLTKNEILVKIEQETREDQEIGKEYSLSTINTAFRNFKKYDLPVSRKKRNVN